MRPAHPLRLLALALIATITAIAAPPSFQQTPTPEGWTLTGTANPDAKALTPLDARLTAVTDSPIPVPFTVNIHFQVTTDKAYLHTLIKGTEKAALLDSRFLLHSANPIVAPSAAITAIADGKRLATQAISSRTWSRRDIPTGSLTYKWRYPRVRNTWSEEDRRDIGSANARLTPLNEKHCKYTFIVTADSRQIWLDGRLVAETRAPLADTEATIQLLLTPGTTIQSLTVTPYILNDPSSFSVPLQDLARSLGQPDTDLTLDLSRSIYRYRHTHGTGPDAPYVKSAQTWPSAFSVDSDLATFRVPYRTWQTAHLFVQINPDAPANAVPAGELHIYRQGVGTIARSTFEITPDAIARGLASQIFDGVDTYTLTVPIDTDGFYQLRDMHDQFLEIMLTKPTALTRSYPDPIYYGRHPAGPPSSLKIVGISLAPSPFTYTVTPTKTAHVFEQPDPAAYQVAVTNDTATPAPATVTITTVSADETEVQHATATIQLPPNDTATATLTLPITTPGTHNVTVTVNAHDTTRINTLTLALLPPDTRSYGLTPADTYIGSWNLWGHYTTFGTDPQANNTHLDVLRRIGIRRIGTHGSFIDSAAARQRDFLPKAPHTIVSVFHRLDETDPAAVQKMVDAELAQIESQLKHFPEDQLVYYYGGEWGPSRDATHTVYPIYQGKPERPLTEAELKSTKRQMIIFEAIGRAIRAKYPKVTLVLQWGSPTGTIPFMRQNFPKELADAYGMDQPMFERLPENLTDGSINYTLWQLRAEATRQGWPQHPIYWCEGPFLPTNPGALTLQQQADYHIRYFLLGLAYGIQVFEAGVVPYQAGNYYGTEHYGAGVFEIPSLNTPKPAVVAINTATTMLEGATYTAPIDTGHLTTMGMHFTRRDNTPMYAFWRIQGTSTLTLTTTAKGPATLTYQDGHTDILPITHGTLTIPVTPSPIWLTGAGTLTTITPSQPTYTAKPTPNAHPLTPGITPDWTHIPEGDDYYTTHHFGVARAPEPSMTVTYTANSPTATAPQNTTPHGSGVSITLPVLPPTAPLLARYTIIAPPQPITIPGAPSHLGIWVHGNSGYGRIAYQLRDAKGEIWTSTGTKDDWNGDDIHALSSITHDGWRYLAFPLPGNHPWDQARTLETTWWGSHHGDGIVDLPLSLERIYVEARNQVPYLGTMTTVPNRTITLAGLTADYAHPTHATPNYLTTLANTRPQPDWQGPKTNPIAHLRANGIGQAPPINSFEEPHQWADGRRMIIHFPQDPAYTYDLYLSLYPDGRGAEKINHPRIPLKTDELVKGLIPNTDLYLFLTQTKNKQESKPSPPYKLKTKDNFAEK